MSQDQTQEQSAAGLNEPGSVLGAKEDDFDILKAGYEELSTYPYHPSVFHASHRGGKGRQAWRILTMRRMPRVNQDVLPRATFVG
jgi:hypothetical protein